MDAITVTRTIQYPEPEFYIITSAKEVIFSPVSICLSVNRITQKSTRQIFLKFYRIGGYNPGTNTLDSK